VQTCALPISFLKLYFKRNTLYVRKSNTTHVAYCENNARSSPIDRSQHSGDAPRGTYGFARGGRGIARSARVHIRSADQSLGYRGCRFIEPWTSSSRRRARRAHPFDGG